MYVLGLILNLVLFTLQNKKVGVSKRVIWNFVFFYNIHFYSTQ